MLFNSLSFVIFFPIVAIAYYIIPQRFRWMLLLVASCYFYMAFIPAYILILFYLITIDFVMGIAIEKSEGKKRKLFLIISLIANVGTLFFFKYFNFFNINVAHVASLIHWNYSPLALMIALPLGLSFHTFQSLSYIIEVYYRRYPAERHLGIYALYVMFFPQLVAGPIERPQQLLPQLHALADFKESNVVTGLRIMLWGFFKKVVVADTIGALVDAVYGNIHTANGVALTVATVAFAIQLYGDFSGYSDIARGSAKVFGVDLVNNFDLPYFSRSIADFWRRWHISLSNWFRDYFYQPLALAWARASKAGIYLALIVTFVVIGLWHGAAWTYIFFGAIFGVYMAIGLLTKSLRVRIANALGISRFPFLYALLQTLTTFALVCVGFIFFRAASLHDAFYIVAHLGTGWSGVTNKDLWITLARDMDRGPTSTALQARVYVLPISVIGMIGGEYWERQKGVVAWLAARPRWVRWGAYYLLILWILAFGYYAQRTFIYFQF